MSDAFDIADMNEAGIDPKRQLRAVKPVNEAARRIEEMTPRILRVDELLVGAMQRELLPRDERARCTSGVESIDNAAGGLRPGHVWVFGAETNWGKGNFLIMLVDENLKRKKRVLIVSNEDSEDIYGNRLMARRAKVNATRLRDGKLTPDERIRVSEVAGRAEAIPVFLDCRRKQHRAAEWIAEQVEKLIKDEGIDMVLYDYLQEFESKKRHQDERVKFRDIATTLRSVIKANNRTGVIFSQITEQAGKTRPDKHSIRECRDVSNSAEAVLLGYTPKEGEMASAKMVLVDKVKDGPKGFAVELEWDGEAACFRGERLNETQTAVRDAQDAIDNYLGEPEEYRYDD